MPKEGARPKTCPLFYGWSTCSSIPCKLIHLHADSGQFKHRVNYRSELVPPLEDEPRVLRLNLVVAARVVGAAETDGSCLLEVGILADEVLGAVADAPVGAGTNRSRDDAAQVVIGMTLFLASLGMRLKRADDLGTELAELRDQHGFLLTSPRHHGHGLAVPKDRRAALRAARRGRLDAKPVPALDHLILEALAASGAVEPGHGESSGASTISLAMKTHRCLLANALNLRWRAQ